MKSFLTIEEFENEHCPRCVDVNKCGIMVKSSYCYEIYLRERTIEGNILEEDKIYFRGRQEK